MSLIITDTRPQAALVLADGEVFLGRGFGASGSVTAEVVFNTAMTGYQEIVTDPSYTGQIVTLTYPHIGNVGVNAQDEESGAVCAAGLIIRSESPVVSNFRSEQSLSDYLRQAGVVGLCDIDTRKLTRILRTKGAQAGTIVVAANGTLTPEEIQAAGRAAAQWGSMVGRDLASEVTCKAPYEFKEGTWTLTANDGTPGFKKLQNPTYKVVAYDFGVKRNILRLMVDRGIELTVVPARTPVQDVLAMNPDGVFLSNGPGDPEPCTYAIEAARECLKRRIPLFGICLANFPEFSLYTFQSPEVVSAMPTAGIDRVVRFLQYVFIDGKFYSLFSLLFGIGFSIMMSHSMEKGRDGIAVFYRRMGLLALERGHPASVCAGRPAAAAVPECAGQKAAGDCRRACFLPRSHGCPEGFFRLPV